MRVHPRNILRNHAILPRHGHCHHRAGMEARMSPRLEERCWIEPQTGVTYPTSYGEYRRTREAQEKALARHRGLGPEVDRKVWQHWRRRWEPDVDVVLTFRTGASPRVQRLVAEVLRAIRRGRPAGEAIRHVARRFGLRHGQAHAFISAAIAFELRVHGDQSWTWNSSLAGWN
jgi:hypothetical protein